MPLETDHDAAHVAAHAYLAGCRARLLASLVFAQLIENHLAPAIAAREPAAAPPRLAILAGEAPADIDGVVADVATWLASNTDETATAAPTLEAFPLPQWLASTNLPEPASGLPQPPVVPYAGAVVLDALVETRRPGALLGWLARNVARPAIGPKTGGEVTGNVILTASLRMPFELFLRHVDGVLDDRRSHDEPLPSLPVGERVELFRLRCGYDVADLRWLLDHFGLTIVEEIAVTEPIAGANVPVHWLVAARLNPLPRRES